MYIQQQGSVWRLQFNCFHFASFSIACHNFNLFQSALVYLQERSYAKKCNWQEMIFVGMFVIKCGISLCSHAFDEPTNSPLENVPASAPQIRDIEAELPW
jgi:hypothetical protein